MPQIRVQVLLEPDMVEKLEREADEARRSLSSLIRYKLVWIAEYEAAQRKRRAKRARKAKD